VTPCEEFAYLIVNAARVCAIGKDSIVPPGLVRQLAFCAVLLGATAAAYGQAQIGNFELQSINAHLTVGPRHILKVRFTGAAPASSSLVMESLHCQLEPDRHVEDPDPSRRRILEYGRKRAEQTKGDRDFGGNIVEAARMTKGAWFVWRVTQVPRPVTSCTIKIVQCSMQIRSREECSPSEELTLVSLPDSKPSSEHEVRIDSTMYRMNDIHEQYGLYVQIHDVINLGPQPILIYPLVPPTPAPGCEIEPVELNNALDDGGVIPQLDPGQRTFFSFAFRLTGTSTTTCLQTARFGQQWLDANGKRVGNALATSSFTLEPQGPELSYVDLLDEIDYR